MSADWRLCAPDCIFLLYVNLVTEGKPLSASVDASHPWHLALRMRPQLRQSIPAVISSRLPSIPARAFLLVFGEAPASMVCEGWSPHTTREVSIRVVLNGWSQQQFRTVAVRNATGLPCRNRFRSQQAFTPSSWKMTTVHSR